MNIQEEGAFILKVNFSPWKFHICCCHRLNRGFLGREGRGPHISYADISRGENFAYFGWLKLSMTNSTRVLLVWRAHLIPTHLTVSLYSPLCSRDFTLCWTIPLDGPWCLDSEWNKSRSRYLPFFSFLFLVERYLPFQSCMPVSSQAVGNSFRITRWALLWRSGPSIGMTDGNNQWPQFFLWNWNGYSWSFPLWWVHCFQPDIET